MRRECPKGVKLGRPIRPIGDIPKNKTILHKQIVATNLFLEEHARKIDSYEQIKDFGDALAFPGEKGLGLLIFITKGFFQVSKGANISIYNPDFSKKEAKLEGNITNIHFEYPDKFYYAVPSSRDLIRSEDECWFSRQDITQFNIPLTQDLLENGLYRVNDANLIEHIGDILKNPSKELSQYKKVTAGKLKYYSFGQQGSYDRDKKIK